MFVLLFLFWMILNGKVTLELVLLGLAFAAVVYLFACLFLKFSFKKDMIFCKNLPLFLLYFVFLAIEVCKSNLNVIALIWSKKTPEPEIVHFDVRLRNPYLRVMFANAITLTPGTITIALEEEGFVVNALRPEYIQGINNSVLLKILLKMEENVNG